MITICQTATDKSITVNFTIFESNIKLMTCFHESCILRICKFCSPIILHSEFCIWGKHFHLMCASCLFGRSLNDDICAECLNVYFFSLDQKERWITVCKLCNEITQPFLNLEGAKKFIPQQHKKSFDIQHQFQHSTPCPNDMINIEMSENPGWPASSNVLGIICPLPQS